MKSKNIKIESSDFMNELVSIVIPTYKRPGMLKRAIDSCLNQTYSNIEILIVDDNNPDTSGRKKTEDFMQEYKSNKKVRYIKRDSNGGGCLSRNTGIEAANGEYLAFLDDDDYFFENKIEKQLNFMKKNNLDASFSGSETYDENISKIVKTQTHANFEKYDNILVYHLVEMIVSPQTFMYKTEVIKSLGGFDNVSAGQEYYLMYKTIINDYKIGCIHDVLTRICIHSGERITTSKNKVVAEKNLLRLKKQHFDILTFKQKRQVIYIYKRNIWEKYKNAGSFKQYLYFIYIIFTNFFLIINRKVIK